MEPFDRQPPRFVPTLTDVVPQGLPLSKPSETKTAETPPGDVGDGAGQPTQARQGLSPGGEGAAPVAAASTPAGEVADKAALIAPTAPAVPAGSAEWPFHPSLPADAADPTGAVEPRWDATPAAPSAVEAEAQAFFAEAAPESEPFVASAMPSAADRAPAMSFVDAEALHQDLVQRILERVQPVLEAQLQDVVASVVLAHMDALVRHVQVAVEDVVHHAVADAIAQEQLQSHLHFDDEIPSER